MDSQILQSGLLDLKKALSLHSSQSKFLYLEGLDPNLLEKLQPLAELQGQRLPNSQPSPRPTAKPSQPPVVPAHSPTTSLHRVMTAPDVSPAAPQTPTLPPSLMEVQKKALDPALATTLDSLNLRSRDCLDCALGECRKSFVFGEGNPKADLMWIGEAPGEDEDRQARPFVGPSGQLLTQMILTLGMSRESVYLCNAVKCRPPGNRAPKPEEVAACKPLLERQIALLKPKVIVTLGNVSTHALLGQGDNIMQIRGKVFTYKDSLVIPTLHPTYLMHSPSHLEMAWEDLRKVRAKLFKKS